MVSCPLGATGGLDASLPNSVKDFIIDESPAADRGRRLKPGESGGIIPLKQGLVIDHIGQGSNPGACWRQLQMLRVLLGLSKYMGGEGVFESRARSGVMKGVMACPDFDFAAMTVSQMKVLASIAPGCTVNTIANSCVAGKYRVKVPVRIYGLPNIRCKNPLCVSNPQNKQRDVLTFFERVEFYETSALPGCKTGTADHLFVCKYCRWPHQYDDIWAGGTV